MGHKDFKRPAKFSSRTLVYMIFMGKVHIIRCKKSHSAKFVDLLHLVVKSPYRPDCGPQKPAACRQTLYVSVIYQY